MKRTVVCLCGSTRFSEAFQRANLEETLAGKIVLTIGCDMRSDTDLFADKTPEQLTQIKADLDRLHLDKIDLADEVLILNVNGYVGESTRRELSYADSLGKRIRWLQRMVICPSCQKYGFNATTNEYRYVCKKCFMAGYSLTRPNPISKPSEVKL